MYALPEIPNVVNVVCNQAVDILSSKKTEYYTDGYNYDTAKQPTEPGGKREITLLLIVSLGIYRIWITDAHKTQ